VGFEMRAFLTIMAFLAATVAAHVPAMAFENFIPAGTGYSTEITTLPDFNSDQSDVNQQADIYETEIYRKKRKYAEDDAALRRFFSQNDPTSIGGKFDY
jgi:hypothetical protein